MHKVGTKTDLAKGKPLSAVVEGQRIAVFLVKDEVVATTGKCPHAGGPLHLGSLCGSTLICPWHGWTYDVLSGACEEDTTVTLTRYAVQIDGDDIYITL